MLVAAILAIAAPLPALAQAETIATLVVNGETLAEVLAIEDGDSLFVEAEILLPFLVGLLDPAVAEALRELADPIGLDDIRSMGMAAMWDPSTLVLELVLPPGLMPPRDITILKRPAPPEGRPIKQEGFSATLNLAARIGVAGDGGNLYIPFSVESDLFLNVYTWVIEAGADIRTSGTPLSLALGRARLVKDFTSAGLRLVGGRIEVPTTGYLSGPRLVGLSLQSMDFRRTARGMDPPVDDIVVDSDATLRILLNGAPIRTVHLGPGTYRLSDMGFATGVNDLSVIVEQAGSDPVTIRRVVPYDLSALARGTMDFAVSTGILEETSPRALATGFVRYGLTDSLEAGLGAQAGFGGFLGQGSLIVASGIGNLGLEAALVLPLGSDDYVTAWAASARYRLGFPGRPGLPTVGLNARYSSAGFTPPLADLPAQPAAPTLRVAAVVSMQLPGSVAAGLSAETSLEPGGGDASYAAMLTLQKRVAAGLTGSCTVSLSGTSGGSLTPGMTLSLVSSPPGTRRSFQYTQDAIDRTSSFDLSDASGADTELEWGVRGRNVLAAPGQASALSGTARLRGYSGDLGLSAALDVDPEDGASGSVYLSGSSALVYAGGLFAICRTVADSFVLLAPRGDLGDRTVTLLVGSASSGLSAGQGDIASALLPAYRPTQAFADIAGGEPEDSVKEQFLVLSPGYRSGTVVRPQMKRMLTVAGRLLDRDGKPITWVPGTVVDASGRVVGSGFTDGDGRFEFYGLEPGAYTVEWLSRPPSAITFELAEDGPVTVDIGECVAAPRAAEGNP